MGTVIEISATNMKILVTFFISNWAFVTVPKCTPGNCEAGWIECIKRCVFGATPPPPVIDEPSAPLVTEEKVVIEGAANYAKYNGEYAFYQMHNGKKAYKKVGENAFIYSASYNGN